MTEKRAVKFISDLVENQFTANRSEAWRIIRAKLAESTNSSHNNARNAIALVRQFARENGHSEGGTMDQYLDRLEDRATAPVAHTCMQLPIHNFMEVASE